MEGANAEKALADSARSSTSRQSLQRNQNFEKISPEVGILDEDAFAEALEEDADEALVLLADLIGATDEKLRKAAQELASKVVVDIARQGQAKKGGIGRLQTQSARHGGEIDIEASLDEIAAARARRSAPDIEQLQSRQWAKPTTALCIVVDRSGSMTGERLATAAVAAACVHLRAPEKTSVVAFGDNAIVLSSFGSERSAELVVRDVFRLRGHGTTDVALALRTAADQLSRATAERKICILLSDTRVTSGPDPTDIARLFDELIVIAPADDDEQAKTFARNVGAQCFSVAGPSQIPEVFARAFLD